VLYDCVIVDEAHRARRENRGPGREGEKPEPNNLLAFLLDISTRTRSLLLATATPVQIHPVEAWDLLCVLDPRDAPRSDRQQIVLGDVFSKWRDAAWALDLVTGRKPVPTELDSIWEWVRNPLPPKTEHPDFLNLRRALGVDDREPIAPGHDFGKLR